MAILANFSLPIFKGALAGKRWLIDTRINFFLGTYEIEQTLAFEANLRPGAVVYDIGAHVGYYTLLASVLCGPSGKVFAFEPSPRNLSRLRWHVSANGCRNVIVFDNALSDRVGSANF